MFRLPIRVNERGLISYPKKAAEAVWTDVPLKDEVRRRPTAFRNLYGRPGGHDKSQ